LFSLANEGERGVLSVKYRISIKKEEELFTLKSHTGTQSNGYKLLVNTFGLGFRRKPLLLLEQ